MTPNTEVQCTASTPPEGQLRFGGREVTWCR